MANQLVPQKRVDKNNRVVTRHVLPSHSKAKKPAVVPAPAIASQFRVHPQDVKKPRRPGTSKSDLMDAQTIRTALSVRPEAVSTGSVEMSDNELYEYMRIGFRIANAIELKRYGADVEASKYIALPRNMGVTKCLDRMRDLYMSPEHAARIIRHGISDRMLDKYLTDKELFELLFKENLNSTKHAYRSAAARELIAGTVTPQDAAELGMEALGTYSWLLRDRRKRGLPVDYENLRAAIVAYEGPKYKVPESRRNEGWTGLNSAVSLPQLVELIYQHGTEVTDMRHPGMFTMNRSFGGTMDGYRFMDKFFSLAQHDVFTLSDEQLLEMWERDPSVGRQVADFVEMLRQDGLNPEQTVNSLRAGLTLDKARQVHINKLSEAMIEGWL